VKKLFSLLLAIIGASLSVTAQSLEKYQMAYGDTVRTYSMYIPEGLDTTPPLIVYAHGYSSRPKNRVRADLNEAAARYGFVVCYPDGIPDSKGKDGWNVGYPSQSSMTVDEADFFNALLNEVCSRFRLDRTEVFLTGMSNGGDLCYQHAYTHPELFKAYASVVGLTFENSYMTHRLTIPVPFLEIHGTADKLSMWFGDHGNTGGWGAYIPVPLAVSAIAANNRCTTLVADSIPSNPGSNRAVMRYTYSGAPSGCDVILYRIEGGPHSWAAADLPTGEIVCRFFSGYSSKAKKPTSTVLP
jgi:polyhydroxybutyrate depolymerase